MEISKIEKRINQDKRVAAYVRVSTLTENQEESFKSQYEYFKEFIGSVPNWKLAGIYADEGISGLSAEKRPGFMSMIRDAEDGKFDLIYTKSISRFGRNSMETQDYIHRLKSCNVEVRFEKEQISSYDPQTEMIFNFLTALAQEESKSISQNTLWAYKKLAQQGIRHLGNNNVLGYDEIDGKLTPNDKAYIVKIIFKAFDSGKNSNEIRKLLHEKGIKTFRGNEWFSRGTILRILKNEIYKGDRLIQKQPHQNYLTHKPDWDQPYTSHYVANDHEAIVSEALWNRVNEKLGARQALLDDGLRTDGRSSFLAGRVYCGECFSRMQRTSTEYHGKYQKVWKCKDRLKGKKGNGCKNDFITDEDLINKLCEIMKITKKNPKAEDFEGIDRVDVFFGNQVRVTLKTEENQRTA